MSKRSFSSPVAGLFVVLLVACGDESPSTAPAELPFIGTPLYTAQNGALALELYARTPTLEVGRNEVAYRLIDVANAVAIASATLSQQPMMTMASHSHACPLTDPSSEPDADGRFLAVLVPTMPSGAMGSWSLDVEVLQGGQAPQILSFGEVSVTERPIPARKDLVVGSDSYVVTLNFVGGEPRVGLNDIIVTVHRVLDMGMSFEPQSDLAVDATPVMPTMGHGSSGNVDPVHSANGDYEGRLNFSMGGAWRVTFALSRAGASLGSVVYDLDL